MLTCAEFLAPLEAELSLDNKLSESEKAESLSGLSVLTIAPVCGELGPLLLCFPLLPAPLLQLLLEILPMIEEE